MRQYASRSRKVLAISPFTSEKSNLQKKKAKIENKKAKGGEDTERMMGQGNRAETWPGNHENAETGGNRISKRRNEDRTQAV